MKNTTLSAGNGRLGWRLTLGLATVIAGGLLLSGCGLFGDGRSVAAACHVWDKEGKALHDQINQDDNEVSSDPLAALAQLLSAPGSIGDLMANMAAVAPSDVEPAFQALAAAFQQADQTESGALSDPLAALGSGLINGLDEQSTVEEVNNFITNNCGVPS